jgi:hypothetical protein
MEIITNVEDPGCLSRIPDTPFQGPGLKKAPDPGSRIRNTGFHIDYLNISVQVPSNKGVASFAQT